jgi:bifunctional DNase/RNase
VAVTPGWSGSLTYEPDCFDRGTVVKMIEMEVVGVALEPNSNRPLVWLKDRDQKVFLPIAIGNFEATAIYMELYNEPPPRPITHDLLRSILQGLEVAIGKIVINALREETFYADIVLAGPSGTIKVDSRPSDAIALALRTGAPIFVAEQVVRQAGMDVEEGECEPTGLPDPDLDLERVSHETHAVGAAIGLSGAPAEQRVVSLKTRLREAVDKENYEEAAKLRDEIEKLE